MSSDTQKPEYNRWNNNPEELACLMDRMAEEAFQNGHEVMMNACMRSATRYRRLVKREEIA